MSDDYNPTIGDLWPNEESTPDEVKTILNRLGEEAERRLAEIDANPKHISKSWWQVDRI